MTHPTPHDALETLAPDDLDAFAARPTETRGAGPIPPGDASLGGVEAIETLAELSDGDALTVHGTLGLGGMAVVRLGRQERLGRMVAVKTLREDASSPGARVRLLREAWVTGRLEHPNIVPVHDVRIDEAGAPLVVLKRISGVDWEDLLRQPDRLAEFGGTGDPLAWHVRVLVSVCHAVQFAHDQGVLHRDIKPSNVRIGEYGEVLLLDWGIAVALEGDPSGRLPLYRRGGPWAGTPAYMAPEMLERGGPPQSRATDVYLLGAVLYRLLSGHPPHQAPDAAAMLASVLGPRPEPPATAPRVLVALCRAALDPDPKARPASAAEFRHALERFLEQRSAEGITDAAEEKLAELRASADLDMVEHSRLAAACEFGFKQALAIDPDSTRARAGLLACHGLAAEHALATGNVQTARAIATHTEGLPADLLSRLEAAEAAEAARQAEVEQLLLDEDASVGGWARTASQLTIAAGVMVGGVAMARMGGEGPGYAVPMGMAVAILAALGLTRALFRDRIFRSRYNRRTWGILAATVGGQLLLDMRNLLTGVDAAVSQAQHPALFAAGFAALAAAVDRRYLLASAAYATVGVLTVAMPGFFHEPMAVANGVMVLTFARVWASSTRPRRGPGGGG